MSKIRYLQVIFIAAAIACGGGAGEPSPSADCDPDGKWSVSFKADVGDCVDMGAMISDVLEVDGDRVMNEDGTFPVSFDEANCFFTTTIESETAETADTYGLSGSTELVLYIDGDTVTGVSELTADVTEGGDVVRSCVQGFSIEGSR